MGIHPIAAPSAIAYRGARVPASGARDANDVSESGREEATTMAKKSRGGRMAAAKKRAAASKGGKGPVKNRRAGKRIMKT